MKLRKSFAFLCFATFSLGLAGCNNGGGKVSDLTFTVTFDSQGGSAVAPIEVKGGEKITKPADPTKENYEFVAWFEDSATLTKFDFSAPITANWTLYAGWKEAVDPTPEPGPEPTPTPTPTPTEITYTITDLPDWITNDGCVIFAWAWSESNPGGSWVSCTYGTPATSLTFKSDEELTGCLLARCVSGTTTPDWKVTGDNPGRIYNQTEDITCTAGSYSYSSPEWKGYSPS